MNVRLLARPAVPVPSAHWKCPVSGSRFATIYPTVHPCPLRGRRVRPYVAGICPAPQPTRRAERPVVTTPTPVLARVLDGLRSLDTERPSLAEELAPLAHAAITRRPEVAQPAERVEPSPDVVRTQPLGVVGVAS